MAGTSLLVGLPAFGARGLPVARKVSRELPATAMDQLSGVANNSPVLVTDPTEERFVVMANRLDAPDFGCALQLSGNGGRTWVTANPVPKLPGGAEKCYGPEAAFDAKGMLYYLFVGLAGPGNEPVGAFLTTSADRGRSFSAARRVLGPLNFAVRMAIDPGLGQRGRIHLVWLHATSDPGIGSFGPPPNPILAAYSDNGGRSFSKPVQVSEAKRDRVVAPALALGPGGRVDIAYYDLQGDARDYQNLEGPVWEGTWSVVLVQSQDGGRHFSPGVDVDASVVPPERPILIFTMPSPALAAGPGSRVCVGWTDARLGDPDVMVRCSPDDGRRWREAVRVNDDPPGNGHRQYMPRLSVAPDGRLDAIFYDRRRDPENAANDVVLASSSDGGRRFTPNLRLTSEPSPGGVGPQYQGPAAEGQYEIGSRLGLLSRRSGVVAAWADTRNSRPQTTGEDIFATTVMLEHARSSPVWARRAGVAFLVVGIAGLVAAVRRRSPSADPQGRARRT
ncbi:MAG: sialidase family protein [Acidimicrobiales bacterium]